MALIHFRQDSEWRFRRYRDWDIHHAFIFVIVTLGVHLLFFKTVSFSFAWPQRTSGPQMTFWGSILSSHDFRCLGEEANFTTAGQRVDVLIPLGYPSQFLPTTLPTAPKPRHPVDSNEAEARAYLKENFLDETKIKKDEQQRLLSEWGLEATPPPYRSLRTFRSIKK